MQATKYQIVIGLEIHVQLSTKSKIFSGAATKFGAEPNTQACLVDLAMPGSLPVVNTEAIKMAVQFGVAINAQINQESVFARKNYFYPDLPKGYQISQMDLPIVGTGELEIKLTDGSSKIIAITRAHLEEDAGKSIHDKFANSTAIDLNRAGTPLLEIVSEPEMNSAAEAIAYAKKIHTLVQYLEISDANMQEGSFRMDVNISLRSFGQTEFGTRAEIKNLNSFKFMQLAIQYEYERQSEILDNGGSVVQETRLYNVDSGVTKSMRSKEEANDYRYFPDPDLLPIIISDEFIASIKANTPELPEQKYLRFITNLGLNTDSAKLITTDKNLALFYETALKKIPDSAELMANWVLGELTAALNKANLTISHTPIGANDFGDLLATIADGTISNKIAKTVFEQMWQTGDTALAIIKNQNLQQITNTAEIEKMVDKIISDNPKQVAQYKSGKTKLMGFFVGQVMKISGGKANPAEINKLLQNKL